MSHFRTTPEGVVASFTEAERIFLGDVIPLLKSVGQVGSDPAATRLNVPVYLDDPIANEEWWRLMESELDDGRRADRELFLRVLDSDTYTMEDGEGDAFLRVINEARLVLGARLGIDVEEDHDTVTESGRRVLDYLGWIQEELTSELTGLLPS